jgi:hypothetical protein
METVARWTMVTVIGNMVDATERESTCGVGLSL